MATNHDTIIAAIHSELDTRLVAAGGSAMDYAIGRDQRGLNARRERVIWDDSQSGGTVERILASGGNPHELARDARTFEVSIWGATRAACTTTLHNLIAATYYAGYQREAVSWEGDYRITADGASRSGVVLTINCTVLIVATLDVFATPTVTSIDGTGVYIPGGEEFSNETQTRAFSTAFSTGFH